MYAETVEKNIPLDFIFGVSILSFTISSGGCEMMRAKRLNNLPSDLCAATRASGPGWENAVNDWQKQGRASGGSHSLGIQPITRYSAHIMRKIL